MKNNSGDYYVLTCHLVLGMRKKDIPVAVPV